MSNYHDAIKTTKLHSLHEVLRENNPDTTLKVSHLAAKRWEVELTTGPADQPVLVVLAWAVSRSPEEAAEVAWADFWGRNGIMQGRALDLLWAQLMELRNEMVRARFCLANPSSDGERDRAADAVARVQACLRGHIWRQILPVIEAESGRQENRKGHKG